MGEEPEDMPGVRTRPQGSGGREDRGGHHRGSRGGPGGRGRSIPFQPLMPGHSIMCFSPVLLKKLLSLLLSRRHMLADQRWSESAGT